MLSRKPTTAFVYLLGTYVIVQFLWWGYHLIDLTRSQHLSDNFLSKRVIMIIGEGSVFLVLLAAGLWKIKTSIRKEIDLARNQQNFVLSVTHELKTPISANKLYLQTSLRPQIEDKKKAELIHKAIEETNRLENLVEQLLAAARIEQGVVKTQLQRVELHDILSELIQLYAQRSEVKLSLKSSIDSLIINTDQSLLITILKNLIENALKYGTTEKGIRLELDKNQTHAIIKVIDFGPGISEENQSIIFKKFLRLENEETRSQKGTGIGLYLSSEFTKAIKGKIKLTQFAPLGACFEIILPLNT